MEPNTFAFGENIKKLKDFENHERALWLATARHKFESAIALPHQSVQNVLDKLDVDTLYRLRREQKPVNVSEIMRALSSSQFIKGDDEGGYDVTNLGAILFAKDIGDFPSITSKSVRVVKYAGGQRKSEGETEGRKGYAVGFSGLIQYVIARISVEEKFKKGIRTTEPIYPEIAVREIMANALIHQDFTIDGVGPLIEIYSDRIQVFNPGSSLIAVDRMIDERRSRNEKLAAAMRMLGLCEERGGGIDKALIEIEEHFLLRTYEWYFSSDTMKVILLGPRTFSEMSRADRVWSCFCHCVIRYIKHDYMSNASLRERFSLFR